MIITNNFDEHGVNKKFVSLSDAGLNDEVFKPGILCFEKYNPIGYFTDELKRNEIYRFMQSYKVVDNISCDNKTGSPINKFDGNFALRYLGYVYFDNDIIRFSMYCGASCCLFVDGELILAHYAAGKFVWKSNEDRFYKKGYHLIDFYFSHNIGFWNCKVGYRIGKSTVINLIPDNQYFHLNSQMNEFYNE